METSNLRDFRRKIQQDEEFYAVIASEAFVRLRGVSFLGALDYAVGSGANATGSRAEHSLNVAALACYVAQERGYSASLTKHLVLAGLLHDIGHAPLSHSVEPVIKEKIGYGHHEQGMTTINGHNAQGKALHRVLSRMADLDFIQSLIDQRAEPVDGGDLFSSPINVDTIEGITRASALGADGRSHLDDKRLAYAKASFLAHDKTAVARKDEFWELKDRVYNTIVNSPQGLAADQLSQQYFLRHVRHWNERELFSSEAAWQTRFQDMFRLFLRLKKFGKLPMWLASREVTYTSRSYKVDHGASGMRRYRCTKVSSRCYLPA